MAWFGDDVRPLHAAHMDEVFHTDPPILQGAERCEMAFKGRRDMVLFTSKRLIKIDRQGWSGKRTEYMSIPWASVTCFAVESAGNCNTWATQSNILQHCNTGWTRTVK